MLVGQNAMQTSSLGYIQEAGTPVSPFNRIDSAVERIANAAATADEIADVLCGSTPKPVENSGGKLGGVGLLDGLAMTSTDLEAYAARINAALARIRERLP